MQKNYVDIVFTQEIYVGFVYTLYCALGSERTILDDDSFFFPEVCLNWTGGDRTLFRICEDDISVESMYFLFI